MSVLLAVLLALTPAELKEDLHILRQTFEDAHAGLYRYTPKAELDAAFDAVEAQLDRPMQELEFYRLLAPLIDRIHDGHTGLSPSRDTLRRLARAKVFPLDVRYIDGRA
ncbi:MAG TPA: hypothetical protein VN181_03080, partial [Thermoanaerobaculia bacterium]|nr:hypothetical protein [Thermoanaerobaculia bacterium]